VPLYERRLNANDLDPTDGQIWHVRGFSGLSHRCRRARSEEGVV